ncbi:MAG: hypothetical protein HY703_00715 [Gemmatimonadetes bacterium]|nr:hypothetical protein [Gemmatimonadota bacterium]
MREDHSSCFSWGLVLCGTLVASMALGGCDEGEVVTEPEPEGPVKASEWLASVNWDQRTVVTLNMVEAADGRLLFSPNQLAFEAGKPYVLRMVNGASNKAKHYVSPEGLGNFYQAIATRKIETSQAEYKAAYFNEVELMVGGSLDLYFVPVLAGTYDILCTIPGHKELGMTARFTITGSASNRLDLEVAADFNSALTSDPRRSGSHDVWKGRVDHTISIVEAPAYAFVPKDLALRQGVGYRLRLESPAANASKHYWTAAQFFKTAVWRKAEDTQAEIKAPYLKEVELMVGGSALLFVVPTQAGTFETRCTLPDHAQKGMVGSITVTSS